MDDALLDDAARHWVALGQQTEAAKWDRCSIAAPMWGDRKSLSRFAERVEETEQSLVKHAGAGVTKGTGLVADDKSVEWAYQLSLWPRSMWQAVFGWDALVDLTPKDLQHLRIAYEKFQSVGMELVVRQAAVLDGGSCAGP